MKKIILCMALMILTAMLTYKLTIFSLHIESVGNSMYTVEDFTGNINVYSN